ncbi:LytTR family DNA-binding domain-containing protein [Draconibacterium sp. IB214405]|uniref:LytR/AlgR family response regulator transcription factor n=1 Tax=Draconibacterium sp. IB214405 TaxID=3097352 RepID=UPI002A1845C7|nr:LytTR family DNA-binding domain-containing protein [Draconibacterium sp. IB214405]MDX8341781.1 LytTR family DNA-binding domain-containing protein [Draconibacterium sp. IB214405]
MINKSLLITNAKYSEIVKLDEVVLIEAQGSYSEVVLDSHRKILATRNLGWFEKAAKDQSFFRVHKSFLVNLNFVQKIFHGDQQIILSNGSNIPLSRNKRSELKKRLIELLMID